jgi:hypothetical protein
MKRKPPEIDLLDKIQALIGDEDKPLQQDEFTLKDFMRQMTLRGFKMSESQVHKRLMKQVDLGTITRRNCVINGRQTNAFRFTK